MVLLIGWSFAWASVPAQAEVSDSNRLRSLDNFVAVTQSAPLELAGAIPLRVPIKIGGSEAFVEGLPSARGAAMLVDTRASGLVSLLVFGTTADPPVKLPSPTVAEVAWTSGPDAQTSAMTQPGESPGRVGISSASAGSGPKASGEAAYARFELPDMLDAEAMSSRSVADGSGGRIAVQTESSMHAVSMLGGAIRIASVHSSAKAVNDAWRVTVTLRYGWAPTGSDAIRRLHDVLGGSNGSSAKGRSVSHSRSSRRVRRRPSPSTWRAPRSHHWRKHGPGQHDGPMLLGGTTRQTVSCPGGRHNGANLFTSIQSGRHLHLGRRS